MVHTVCDFSTMSKGKILINEFAHREISSGSDLIIDL